MRALSVGTGRFGLQDRAGKSRGYSINIIARITRSAFAWLPRAYGVRGYASKACPALGGACFAPFTGDVIR